MNRTQQLHAWLLLLPALVMLAAFTHTPAVQTLLHSFYDNPMGGKPSGFVGMENFELLLEDEIFWQVLWNNTWYGLVTVPASIALALTMAIWVNGRLEGRAIVRLAYFTPTVLPMIAVANIWLFFYTPEIGLLNNVLGWFGIDGINWLGDPDFALPSLMAMTIWKEAGFFMIFYLAALQGLDRSLYEAAAIENAGRWQVFQRITWPLLMPTTLFIFINALINAFKLVDHLFILTKGGPNNASNLLLYYIYENAFSFFDTAYAATLTTVMLIILALLAWLQFGVLDKGVHYR
ncbi:sugar ABC transporter permease [Parendozoicomonas sp. Alg238-R29]|uniref:carbohydrate ABC transporter permease n=1 Tax=Parendozoicomonas sp. Alg238-R29 TaxID=2993446 RepID=UPI00248D4517|nr:sugar ABC transporter permease [Parendozoicomonas sp. Alg238-R29]